MCVSLCVCVSRVPITWKTQPQIHVAISRLLPDYRNPSVVTCVTGTWGLFISYTALLLVVAWCFLGIGMLISSIARSADVAQGAAFIVWLFLLLFMDLILLGVMIQEGLPPETAVMISLINPLQVFRTAAMMLFDPQLVLLGPAAYIILDIFGSSGYLWWSLIYPLILGSLSALLGYQLFKRGDLP